MKFIYSERYLMDIGPHVFPVIKFKKIKEKLLEEKIVKEEEILEPTASSLEDLQLVHTPEYLDDLKNGRWTQRTMFSELPLTPEIVEGYILNSGGTFLCSSIALQEWTAFHIGGGFHHAFADKAEGFCYINDLAYGIKKLQKEGKIRRACVVDCDVHQGNGTAKIFQGDDTVFTFSIHQENNYPIKQKSDIDIGLLDGVQDEEYIQHLKKGLEVVGKNGPYDLTLYQAGADPYKNDLLGGLGLTIEGLKKRDEIVARFFAETRTPVCVTLGGGYAQDVEDTIRIHLNTALVFKEVQEEMK